MKVLNLYAGIGGNRKLWKNCEVTAVENNPVIAGIYKEVFPKDNVIIADAHGFLLDHYKEYDFIWSSPPCQSHSSFRQNICVRYRGTKAVYPDMRLWQEIIFLNNNLWNKTNVKWVVENVVPYYGDDKLFLMVRCKKLQRHLFWSNFEITDKEFVTEKIRTAQIPQLQKLHGFDLSKFKLKNKRQVLRNCVHPKLGQHVMNCAIQNINI